MSLLAVTTYAQKGFHVGVTTGLNNTALIDKNKYGDANYDYDLSLKSSIGLSMGMNFTDVFGIEAEINNINLGQNYTMRPLKGFGYDKSVNLSYTQIPVLLKYTGGDFSSRFSASFGPVFGYLNDATVKDNEGKRNSWNEFYKNDFGIMMNGGGEINVYKNLYLAAGLRFYYGLNDINKAPRVVETRMNDAERMSNAYAGIYAGLHYLIRSEGK